MANTLDKKWNQVKRNLSNNSVEWALFFCLEYDKIFKLYQKQNLKKQKNVL